MRILALTTRSPWPLNEGRALRSFHLLRALAREHEVHLLSFVQNEGDVEGLPVMRQWCASAEAVPLYLDHPRLRLLGDAMIEPFGRVPLSALKYRTEAMRARVTQRLAQTRFDAVHLDMLHLGEYLPLFKGCVRVLNQHNVESDLLRRRAQTEGQPMVRRYLAYQADRLARYESALCAAVDRVITVSDLDAERLAGMTPGLHATVVPNGVDTDYFRAPAGVDPVAGRMVFVGGFGWKPNLDGIEWFAKEVLPRITARVPHAHLVVVGHQPERGLPASLTADPRIERLGAVPDIRPHVCQGAVFVVPLRIGGGTRLKILDALALERAVVSTSIGCEGLDLELGRSILVADTAEAFAEATVQALTRADLARSLGEAGRERVRRTYEWDVITQGLDALYQPLEQYPQGPDGSRRVTAPRPVEWMT